MKPIVNYVFKRFGPRIRDSTLKPVIIPKHEKSTHLFNDQIISMNLFGMSSHDIHHHVQQLYGVEVSPETIVP